jgi:hypothetical protein
MVFDSQSYAFAEWITNKRDFYFAAVVKEIHHALPQRSEGYLCDLLDNYSICAKILRQQKIPLRRGEKGFFFCVIFNKNGTIINITLCHCAVAMCRVCYDGMHPISIPNTFSCAECRSTLLPKLTISFEIEIEPAILSRAHLPFGEFSS